MNLKFNPVGAFAQKYKLNSSVKVHIFLWVITKDIFKLQLKAFLYLWPLCLAFVIWSPYFWDSIDGFTSYYEWSSLIERQDNILLARFFYWLGTTMLSAINIGLVMDNFYKHLYLNVAIEISDYIESVVKRASE